MNGFLVIGGILLFVVGIYILTYYLNQNTEAPEGVEQPSCEACHSMSCSLRSKGGPVGKDESAQCEVSRLD